jgi:type IV secretory pathway VirJ component
MLRLLVVVCCAAAPAAAQSTEALSIRGHSQSLRIYGARGGQAVIVSSGDGGWIHLGPHVAELLAANGYFVVGFDAKPAWKASLRAG